MGSKCSDTSDCECDGTNNYVTSAGGAAPCVKGKIDMRIGTASQNYVLLIFLRATKTQCASPCSQTRVFGFFFFFG